MTTMFIKNLWYVAAWNHELGSDKPISRTIIGEPIAFYRKQDGSVVAVEDRCPHRQAPLSMGRIEGDNLRCMYHGLVFGCDGVCKSIPGSEVMPPHTTARTFPATEKASWIWVWMGDPAKANVADIPDGQGLDNPAWVTRSSALDYAADYQLINDNLTDLSHLDFVHETTLGWASGSKWSEDSPKITRLDNGVLIERWFVNQVANPGEAVPVLVDTWNEYRFLLPGLFLMISKLYPLGTAAKFQFGPPAADEQQLMWRFDQQAVTPIRDGETRYLYAAGVEARIATAELLEGLFAIVNAAFAEDKRMIEAQQKVWNLTPSSRQKAFIPQDKAPAMFRRMIARRLQEEQGPVEVRKQVTAVG
jgi:phenylpropionate dioxygenase-like ring-hydroxylating dioxygenase large terminal subunit